MPYNFSFVIPGKLAGMACPPSSPDALRDDLQQLKKNGIGAIVSLTEYPPEQEVIMAEGVRHLHLPIADFTPPQPEQIESFIEFADAVINKGNAVAVHCGAGIGRTGTMLACYLVYIGESAAAAIDSVRRIRPGSIETSDQERCVMDYADRLQKEGKR